MIVIGIDSHKDTLAGCLITETGRLVEYRVFVNAPQGHAEVVSWAQSSGAGRVAIEGAGSYGRPVALTLLDAGVDTVEVPPQMTARARRGQRTQQKTDETDALLIARVGAREHDLPSPRPNGDIEDLRCLVRYRSELVKDRQQNINRLHTDLEQLRCGYHHKIVTSLTSNKALTKVSRLISGDHSPRARVVRHRIRRIRDLDREIKDLNAVITTAVGASGTTLTQIHGVGVLTAAEILTEVGHPHRYTTKDKFAMANGTAPIQASSGRIQRHRLNRGGNRQLNRALHRVAITQISRPDTEGRSFYERKLGHGKTKKEAIRALKRRISDRVWTHLQQTPTTPKPTHNLA